MLLVGVNGPEPIGTMDAHAISPSTTAVIDNLGDSTVLGLSVEPPGGSRKPPGAMFAELRLSWQQGMALLGFTEQMSHVRG